MSQSSATSVISYYQETYEAKKKKTLLKMLLIKTLLIRERKQKVKLVQQ